VEMKALLLAVLAVCALAYTEQEYQGSFVQWMTDFSKEYAAEEFFYRYGVFKATMDRVAAHNAKNESWTAGLTQFSDLTNEEFGRIYASGYIPYGKPIPEDTWQPPSPGAFPTTSIDWSTQGAVTPIKNQGQCGSCWAFSTTGSVEGWTFLMKNVKPVISLSEEELVQCSGAYGNQGCNGGMYTNAGKFIAANGDCTESAYPYTASTSSGVTGTCTLTTTTKCTASTQTTTLTAITMFTGETNIGSHLNTQPVSVAIQANQPCFQDYTNGIMCAATCGTSLDHAVLVVGYMPAAGANAAYWKVKNSWGTGWGTNPGAAGYIYMCEGKNECGIGQEPGYAH